MLKYRIAELPSGVKKLNRVDTERNMPPITLPENPVEKISSPRFEADFKEYSWFKSKACKAYQDKNYEQALAFAHLAATFAWQIHIGFWYDSELERLLKKLGADIAAELPPQKETPPKETETLLVVHIATALYEMGGHSKVVRTWINALQNNCRQTLYIVGDESSKPISFLQDLVEKGVQVRSSSCADSYVDRIKWLIANLEQDPPQKIILYIHPNDVLTIATLNGLRHKVPIVFFNHSDHFWVGRDIVDHLVEWRNESIKYSRKYRQIPNSSVVPLTFDIKIEKHDKNSSKKQFDIPLTATVSLTVGREEKVSGDPNWNYYLTIEKLLEKNPNHYHISIGTPLKNPQLNPAVQRRFIILDRSPQVSIFYNLADFLIESFPAIGGTVRIEAIAYHLPIVAVHNRKFSLLSDSDALPPDYPFQASNTDEVVDCGSKLVENSDLRTNLGDGLAEYYNDNFGYDHIRQLILETVLGQAKRIANTDDCKYDATYYYEWTRNTQSKNLQWEIIAFACKKQLSFINRMRLCIFALRSGSLSGRQKAVHFFLAATGKTGYNALFKLKKLEK
jgi:glycosyltransferase involved in cell wall biosynthesis